MAKVFWMLLRIGLIVYLLFGLLLYLQQERSIFYPDLPSRELSATPADMRLAYENVEFSTADGVRLHGWFVPAENARGVILFFHGNAGNISQRLDSLQIFHDLGYAVLIFDYRGYGQSEGRISEAGTYLDAQAAWHYLTGVRHTAAGDIVLFGRSLGGTIATYLASNVQPRALIVESSLTSVDDFAADLYPLYPVRLLLRYHYPAIDYIRAVHCPVLVIHSADDEIIPLRYGQRLFAAANEPKQWLSIHGGHNDGFVRSGAQYSAGLGRFLADLRQGGASGAD